MSRTDKDAPHRARAEWWEPYHNCAEFATFAWRRGERSCTLPAEPTAEWQPVTRWRSCHWTPVTDRSTGYSRSWRGGHLPKWYIDHVWNNRVRTLLRAQLRRAAAEFRAAGDVDVISTVDQHRHCARWLWD